MGAQDMMRIVKAFVQFVEIFLAVIGTFFVLMLSWAGIETYGKVLLQPYALRKFALIMVVVLSLIAGFWRWRAIRRRARRAAKDVQPEQQMSKPGQVAGKDANRVFDLATAMLAPSGRAPAQSVAVSGDPVVGSAVDLALHPAVMAATGQAILFHQIFPPPHDRDYLSCWGGVPLTSGSFIWPRGKFGQPLHFIMQLDCSEVPEAARLDLLPDSGMLYLFQDLNWAEGFDCSWLYEPADAGSKQPLAPPQDLGPAYGKQALYQWKWAAEESACPRLLPRRPFRPVAITIPEQLRIPADHDAAEDGPPILWQGADGLADMLEQVQGGPVTSSYFSVKELSTPDEPLVRPFDNFPHDPRAILHCAALMADRAERSLRHPETWMFKDLTEADRTALLHRIRKEALEWRDMGATRPPFSAVSRKISDHFWSWLRQYHKLAKYVLPGALPLSVEDSLEASAEAAGRVPAKVAERMRFRHVFAQRSESGMHVNTPDRMLAAPIDIQGNNWERAHDHLLLLEISSNDGIGHHLGDGVLQYWIKPDDLAARRFDRVEVTADSH